MGILLLPAFLAYAAAVIYAAIKSYKIIELHGVSLWLGLLLAAALIYAILPTLNVYLRFKDATSLWAFDVPISLLFNPLAAVLLVASFVVLKSHLLISQPLQLSLNIAATGVLLGISVGTVLGLFFAEQLLGLDQLPRTH
ncbi:ABC-type phosphate/phosphonate transport system permease subunit [Rheinheimera pacifica]|uniref:hypothetical protein n=1 Tax=Rheinheimera pacifica TaxID=173990 RepID=UPI0021686089|nr:hypothetical protein [Rheinheimera pacifica]MCS4308182.1 ABC-type phosphate/phosphonate transport system permease subunit [Rheinheimera pacifica]